VQTHLQRLGEWAATVRSIPDDVRYAARAQMLDMVAAVHATARGTIARPVLDGLHALGAAGPCTSLADGARLAAPDAAIANTACSMAHDYDDIVWMGHTAHSAVFAALAVGELVGAQTTEVVDAIVVANELAGRLGASSILGPLNGQMWTFIHLIGAAAATARLLRLDAEHTTHALAIALAQPNFALQPAFLRPTSKLLAAATPTATGIRAAYFAQAGLVGAPEILEDPRGFWQRFAFVPLPEMLSDLGEFWVLRTLAIKTYPGCHYFQTALAATERILARRGADLTLDRVRRIQVDATKLACEATRFGREYAGEGDATAVSVNFDLARSVAVMLCARRFGVEQLDEPWLHAHAAELRAWSARVEVRHDPQMTARTIACARRVRSARRALSRIPASAVLSLVRRYRQEYRSTLTSPGEVLGIARGLLRGRRAKTSAGPRPDGPLALEFAGRVTVELTDGSTESERVDVPPGALAAPSFAAEIEAKALRELVPRLGEARARAAIDLVWNAGEMGCRALVAELAFRAPGRS
jgi:2-methylcitrate dehydratase PrpD